MAELTQKERLQPSLLDRLIDDAPHERHESRDQRVLTLQQLRECVLRDLAWLMNTENMETSTEFDSAPWARQSVLNFGIPSLAGLTASSLDLNQLERQVKAAVLLFEPRILADSLEVRAIHSHELMNRKTLMFEIEGELWAQPVPLRMFLRTELDLETGNVVVTEEPI